MVLSMVKRECYDSKPFSKMLEVELKAPFEIKIEYVKRESDDDLPLIFDI